MYVCLCTCVAHGGQERLLDPQEREILVAVRQPMWVLGIKFQSFVRPGSLGLLTLEQFIQPLPLFHYNLSLCKARVPCWNLLWQLSLGCLALVKAARSFFFFFSFFHPLWILWRSWEGLERQLSSLKHLMFFQGSRARFSSPILFRICKSSSRRPDTLFWPLWGPGTHMVRNCAGKIPTHIK